MSRPRRPLATRRILAASVFAFFLFIALAGSLDSKPLSGFAPDKGTLKILVNGQQAGK